MKTILHATDFSENAIVALKYAAELSIKTKSNLFVVHVFNVSTLSSGLNDTYLLPFKETLKHKNAKLKEFCETHLENEFIDKLIKNALTEEEAKFYDELFSETHKKDDKPELYDQTKQLAKEKNNAYGIIENVVLIL